jgi:thymidylate kinase
MRIILEGCDGSGKSTLSEFLASKYACDIIHMTRWSDKSFDTYVKKISLNDNIIFDRCFISEYVYSKIFNRKTEITDEKIELLLDLSTYLNYNIYILTCNNDQLIKRLKERNNETDIIINNIIKINDEYLNFARKYNIQTVEENLNEII